MTTNPTADRRGPVWQVIDSSGVGGAERHIETLTHGLIRRGVPTTVVLYANHGRNPWIEQLQRAGIPFTTLDNSLTSFRAVLSRETPRLVHLHGYKAGLMGRLAALLAGIPTVTTFHTGARGKFPLWAYEMADEWTSILGARISVSEGIQRRLPYSSIVVPSFLEPREPPSHEAITAKRVGFVGRFSEEKRPELFCEMASRIGPGLEWHMYGDGPLLPGLKARYGDRIRFHGSVTDMTKVWPTLGALVITSRSEGLPLVVLEAFSFGVPVISSDVGDIHKLVHPQDTGWLFASGNLDRAVHCVQEWSALDMPTRLQIGRRCWAYVTEHYSEARQLPRVLDIYRSLGVDFGGVGESDMAS